MKTAISLVLASTLLSSVSSFAQNLESPHEAHFYGKTSANRVAIIYGGEEKPSIVLVWKKMSTGKYIVSSAFSECKKDESGELSCVSKAGFKVNKAASFIKLQTINNQTEVVLMGRYGNTAGYSKEKIEEGTPFFMNLKLSDN